MNFTELLREGQSSPENEPLLLRLAEAAFDTCNEAQAIPLLDAAARRRRTDPGLWQWSALLHRAVDDRVHALQAYEVAARLAPKDKSIAHGHARTAWEAGLPAVSLYEKAVAIAPMEGEILLGLAAARLAEGHAEEAIDQLETLVRQHPGWLAGHRDLAQLRWMMGDRETFIGSYNRALSVAPRDMGLWRGLIDALIHAGLWDRAGDAIERGRAAGADVYFDVSEAIMASEQARVGIADALFKRLDAVRDITLAVHQTRHLLRNGRVREAVALIDGWLGHASSHLIWPYAATAWRLANDPRAAWLEGPEALIRTIDISDRLPPIGRLTDVLRRLHDAQGEQFDQSVRGGTQTNGILFARIEPEVQALRAIVADAVEDHVAKLPAVDDSHPTLRAPRRHKPRFSGSWSVRLRDGGHHTHHVHPAGWLSSALYIALPDAGSEDADAGSLVLGQPPEELGIDLAPIRIIKPKPGLLALFPSTMWHGTRPFASGERLTVAFDVQSPSQVTM